MVEATSPLARFDEALGYFTAYVMVYARKLEDHTGIRLARTFHPSLTPT